MKNLNVLLLCLMLGISIGYAQERTGRGFQQMDPNERAGRRVEQLTNQLQLVKTQQDSIYKYALAQANHEKKAFAEAQGDRQKIRDAIQQHRRTYSTKIKSFLRPEQLEKYEKLEKQWEQRRQSR